MGHEEIASAVALASLASFSPSTKVSVIKALEKSQAIPASARLVNTATSFATAETFEDPDNSGTEPTPISPDPKSPIRSIKRVHFASNVKAKEQVNPETPRAPRAPRTHGNQFEFQSPIGGSPHGYPMQANHHPHYHHRFFGMYPPMAVHHHQSAHWVSPRMPPQRMRQHPYSVPPPVSTNWICDFCNSASFNSFEEACMHEEKCKIQCKEKHPRKESRAYGAMPPLGTARLEGEVCHVRKAPVPVECYSGCIALAIPESDSEWLSEVNCFIRKYCVEAFSATEEDVQSTSKRGRIALYQVGIRCRYCKHKPMKERAVAAVSYPTSVDGIYESVKRWVRVHKDNCDIPDYVHQKMADLHNQNAWIPTTRQYWADSARVLGMIDTEEGIRFGCDLKLIRAEANTNSGVQNDSSEVTVTRAPSDTKALEDGEVIVSQEDMRIVPPYVYFLMSQVESCHFSEVDRFVARSKGPLGYPGFQCRHCSGHAGLGKYFPVSAKTLSTNSTSQNIHAHLLKCRKCPEEIKDKLVTLKAEKGRSPRLEPGWRKVFFDKIWARLHG